MRLYLHLVCSCAICPLLGKVLVTKGAKMCYVSFYSLLYRISHYLVKEAYRQVSKGKILGLYDEELNGLICGLIAFKGS